MKIVFSYTNNTYNCLGLITATLVLKLNTKYLPNHHICVRYVTMVLKTK